MIHGPRERAQNTKFLKLENKSLNGVRRSIPVRRLTARQSRLSIKAIGKQAALHRLKRIICCWNHGSFLFAIHSWE